MRTQCQRPDCAEPAAVAYRFDAARQMVILDQLRGSLDAEVGALCARHAATMVLPRGWWLDDRRQAIPTLFATLKMQLADHPGDVRRRRVVAPRRSPDAPRGAVVRRRRGESAVGDAPVIVDVPPIPPAPKPSPKPAPPTGVAAAADAAPATAPADGPLTIEALVERFMAQNPGIVAPSAAPVPVEPVAAEPTAAEPTAAEPTAVEPVMAEPVVAEPVVAEPVTAEPVVAEPVAAEPVVEPDPTKPLWTPDFDAEDDLGGLLNATSPLLSRAFSGRSTPRPRRTPGSAS